MHYRWQPVSSIASGLPLPPYVISERQAVEVRHELRRAGFAVSQVDLANCISEEETVRAVGLSLGFDSDNWDAFGDLIGDRSYEGGSLALVIQGCGRMLSDNPALFIRTVYILQSLVVQLQFECAASFQFEVFFGVSRLPGAAR